MARNPYGERDVLSSYLSSIRHKRRLDREQERQLLDRVIEGDRAALDDLVENNLGFVVRVASEFRGLGLPFEDLLNEGNLGLIEAARRFDPGRGVKFITYAIWWIRKAILQALSDKSTVVRVPYAQQRRAEKIRRAEARLRARLGRDPSRQDVARELELGEREIEKALQARLPALSLARPAGEDSATPVEEFVRCSDKSPEQQIIDRESQRILERCFVRLTDQQKTVITLRFGLDGEPRQTLQELGERLDVSRERIRQIEKQALAILRRWIRRSGKQPYRRPA